MFLLPMIVVCCVWHVSTVLYVLPYKHFVTVFFPNYLTSPILFMSFVQVIHYTSAYVDINKHFKCVCCLLASRIRYGDRLELRILFAGRGTLGLSLSVR